MGGETRNRQAGPATGPADMEGVNALLEREDLFRAFFENAPVGKSMTAPDGRLLRVNRAFCEMLGYSTAELQSMSFDAITHPDDVAGTIQGVRSLLAGERDTWKMEKRYLARDGRVVWTHLETRLQRDEAGRPLHLPTHIQDITERKRAEESLRASEKRFRTLVEGAPDAVFIQMEGRFAYLNPAALSLFGVGSADELLGRPVLERIHPSFHARVKQRIQRLNVEQKVVPVLEESFLRLDGAEVPVEVAAVPMEYEGGHGSLVYVRDISERKRMEAALRQIEWMLSSGPEEGEGREDGDVSGGYRDLVELNRNGRILEAVGRESLGVITGDYLDMLGTSSAVNELNGDYALGIFTSGWCRMMDRASRELCGTADDAEALASGRWLCHESCWTDCSLRAIETQGPVDIACNGGIRLYAEPVFAGEEVVGAINFGYGDPPTDPARLEELARRYKLDVEDLEREACAYLSRPPYIVELARKRLRASARLIGALVERRRAERERDQLQEQLLQSQKMEAVGKLAGGVAHDFNNLMSVVTGYCELIREHPDLPARVVRQVDEVARAGRRAVDVTRHLLAFSRKQILRPETFDVNRVVHGRENMLQRLIGEDILLECRTARTPAFVHADPGQIEQVIVNLAVNARDAMPQGGKLTLETACVELDDRVVEIVPGMKVLFMSGYTDESIHHHGVLGPGAAFIEKPFSSSAITRKIRDVLDATP